MNSVIALLGLGTPELLMILAVVLLLFGGSKLPSLARGLGQSIREFKKASTEEEDKVETKTTEITKTGK